jgi:hypothetical protein
LSPAIAYGGVFSTLRLGLSFNPNCTLPTRIGVVLARMLRLRVGSFARSIVAPFANGFGRIARSVSALISVRPRTMSVPVGTIVPVGTVVAVGVMVVVGTVVAVIVSVGVIDGVADGVGSIGSVDWRRSSNSTRAMSFPGTIA